MNSEPTIAVIGVDSNDRDVIARTLEAERYQVFMAENPEVAERRGEQQGVDLVISDLQAPNFDALDVMRKWTSRQPGIAFVLITEDRDVISVVEAMKLGASDCLVKPVDPEELRMLVSKLLDARDAVGRGDGDFEGSSGGRGGRSIEIPPGTSLEDLQRAAVEQALAQHHGNRTHAAKTLGISVRTLQRKLKAWGMPLAATPAQASHHHFFLAPHQPPSSFSAHAH
jgi:DNA-binding NtrC family response regulator